MKLLIAGSRSIKEFDLAPYIPEKVTEIISGGAEGIDTLAEQYADKHKLSKHIIRPEYNKYGNAAPILRNRVMVELCDEALIIWDGKSRGTSSTIKYAKDQEKKATVINISDLQRM
jgi:predicted Rossmann fold nucleotide-binding protein DprA/Smf involved in DNA uptake